MNLFNKQSQKNDRLHSQASLKKVELEFLRASTAVIAIVTLPSLIGMSLASFAIAIFLWDSIPAINICLWLIPVLIGTAVRYWITDRALKNSTNWEADELEAINRKLYISSLVSQFLVGSGIWSIALYSSPTVAIFITAIICFYGIGVMTNLSSDFKTFSHTIPLLLGQPLLFWLLKGSDGIVVVAPIFTLMLLSLRMVHFSSETFRNSILIRFEKSQLLGQLEEAQLKTENALKSTQQANKMKDYFMAAAGHDLRQPLFAIALLNETMMMRKSDEETQKLLTQQQASIASLGYLFDSLLDLSRFEQGKIHPHLVEFNLKNLWQMLTEEFQLACDKKGITFNCDPMDQKVFTDFDLITQVIRNLFSNAVRYTTSGGITILGEITEAGYEITLKDTGIGIPKEGQQAIFEEFVQLNKGEIAKEVGVGMGLAIVKKISQLLGLNLVLNSVPNEGSAFRFTLPLKKTAA
ncbi:MAG: signal transduction histidine kinase [Candidatus Azotimanducaceae bacterium]|jgi:signal transduction histidine kinase